MKTLIITISLILGIQTIYGRGIQQLDTIYANERMNVALFFPTDIRQGIVGSKEFVFTYNRELGQPLGLLKASKGNQVTYWSSPSTERYTPILLNTRMYLQS